MGPDSGTCWMSLCSPWCVLCDWGWGVMVGVGRAGRTECRLTVTGRRDNGRWLEQCSNSQLMRGAKSSPNKRLTDWMREEQMQCGATNLMEWHTTLSLTLDPTPTAPLWINNQAPREDFVHFETEIPRSHLQNTTTGNNFFSVFLISK